MAPEPHGCRGDENVESETPPPTKSYSHVCAFLRGCPKGSLLDPKEIKNLGIYDLKNRNLGPRGEDGGGESYLYSY